MTGVNWASLPTEHPLAVFAAELPKILESTGHDEMFGVKLVAPKESTPAPHSTLVILQKFLRANAGDLSKAQAQLTEALKWRKEFKPLEVKDEAFNSKKFGGLGFVTKICGAKDSNNAEDVATFNIYGAAAKDPKNTFGDVDQFVRWRVALMELTLSQLHLESADKPVPDYGHGPDPYQAIQVHDYLSVSFFRQPGEIRTASSKIIDMFQRYYPETVSRKYFVNIPLIMQWMMGAMKAIMSSDSIQKTTWLTYGNTLHTYIGQDVPKAYGGNATSLEERGITTKFGNMEQTVPESETAPTAAEGTAASA